MDRCDVGETTIARRILGKLRENMLCLPDRNFLCYPLWQQAVGAGAKLVWRAKLQLVIPQIRKLPGGSYLAARPRFTFFAALHGHDSQLERAEAREATCRGPGRPQPNVRPHHWP